MLWYLICIMAPFSLYQDKLSKCLLDTWLGIGANWFHKSVWYTLMSNTRMDVIDRCVILVYISFRIILHYRSVPH